MGSEGEMAAADARRDYFITWEGAEGGGRSSPRAAADARRDYFITWEGAEGGGGGGGRSSPRAAADARPGLQGQCCYLTVDWYLRLWAVWL
jgi:hypothetical protein